MKSQSLTLRASAIPAACWAALACLSVSSVHAQTGPGSASQSVTIAALVPVGVRDVAADAVLIDSARIRASSATTLGDLLRAEAGVQLSQNGGPGQSAGVFIRGANSGNTLVLVDGMRVGSATLGYADLAALGLAQIERVEVLRGPASSLFGSDAVGGVVLVSTRRGQPGVQWSGQALAGQLDSHDLAASVSGASGAWDGAASVSDEVSRGVSALRAGDRFGNFNPDRDGFHRQTAQGQLGFTPSTGHRLGLNLMTTRLVNHYDGSEFLPPSYAQNAAPDFQNHLSTQLASLAYDGRLSGQWRVQLRAGQEQDDLRSGGTQLDRYTTRRSQWSGQAVWTPASGHTAVLALDHLQERAQATSLLAPVSRSTAGVAAGYVGRLDLAGQVLTVQADARLDNPEGQASQRTARLGLNWQVAPDWRVRGLAGSTFHAPSFNDLYYPGYGVANLRPERGHSGELGLNWQGDHSQAALTLWRNRVADLVAYESDNTRCPNDPAYSYGCASNIGQARLSGVTLDGQTAWQQWTLRATYNYLDAMDGVLHTRLARRARNQLSLDLQWQQGPWTLGAASLWANGRQDGGAVLRGRQTVDLQARWQWQPQWQLVAKLINAGNADYEPARDYQTPGRQAWLGMRYTGKAM